MCLWSNKRWVSTYWYSSILWKWSWYPFGGRGHTSENFNNEVIKELAEKYNKTSAQIILRWQLQADYIAIPGSSNPEHIRENYNIFDFELSQEDMNKIKNINKNQRYENW